MLQGGHSVLGFWNAMIKYSKTHSTNALLSIQNSYVLASLHKGTKPKVNSKLREILARRKSLDAANKAIDVFLVRFSAKYPVVIKKPEKDREELLAFYDFLSAHLASIRTTNPIKLALRYRGYEEPTRKEL
ncbi:MAG: transposase [Arsenophonus sp. NEOnobi-MAG3]